MTHPLAQLPCEPLSTSREEWEVCVCVWGGVFPTNSRSRVGSLGMARASSQTGGLQRWTSISQVPNPTGGLGGGTSRPQRPAQERAAQRLI